MVTVVPLLNDRPPAVAIRAANLTLSDLTFKVGDGAFPSGELHDTPAFDADVVEVQHDRIVFLAINARRLSEVLEKEQQVAAA